MRVGLIEDEVFARKDGVEQDAGDGTDGQRGERDGDGTEVEGQAVGHAEGADEDDSGDDQVAALGEVDVRLDHVPETGRGDHTVEDEGDTTDGRGRDGVDDGREFRAEGQDRREAGRDAELPYSGMMLTTMVAEAGRMVKLQNGPESFPMELSGIAIGPVALIGIPGEPFTGIGRGLKEAPGWDLVLPCCLTNGNEGYFPMQDAYDEGGYEARSSNFKAGVAELLIAEGTKLLDGLRG